MSDAMKPLIFAASEGPLSQAQARQAFELLFDGDATPAQIGGLLIGLRMKGVRAHELAGAARVPRLVDASPRRSAAAARRRARWRASAG